MRLEIVRLIGKLPENYCFSLPTLRDSGGPLLWHVRLGLTWRFCIAKEETPAGIKPLKIYPRQARWTRGNEEGNMRVCLKLYQALTREMPPPWHWFAPQWWESRQQCSCSCTTSHHLPALAAPAFLHRNSHLLHCTHSPWTQGMTDKENKLHCRVIQGLTGKYLHKTVLVSCVNGLNSELRVSGFAMIPIYFLVGKHRDEQ